MAKAYDLKGKRFHSLVVIDRCNVKSPSGKTQWVCECDCGACLNVVTQHLVSGNTKTCGCGKIERAREQGTKNKKHGLTKTVEYKTWVGIKQRCLNPRSSSFSTYGGRGISVCDRWITSFELFLKDMGMRPSPEHSIDRKDPDGDYEPDNCHWATAEEQANNRRRNKKYEIDGKTLTIAQISREYCIPTATLYSRLFRDNLDIVDAVNLKANHHLAEYNGVVKRLHEWSKELGIPYPKIYRHVVVNGKPLEGVVKSI